MRLLLDTHLLLWSAASVETGTGLMPQAAADMIDDADNELHFSSVSIWEVAIKSGQKKAEFQVDPHFLRRSLRDNGYVELAVDGAHAAGVMLLPDIHKDPFDRLLVSQARVEGLLLLTVDAKLDGYPGPILRV